MIKKNIFLSWRPKLKVPKFEKLKHKFKSKIYFKTKITFSLAVVEDAFLLLEVVFLEAS